jgi:sugar/nucleoside kinase (ribokinase family)
MGNALVDVLIRMDDDLLLESLHLPKGSMQLVDEQSILHIMQHIDNLPKETASGGSAANTINGLAALGVHAGYIGKVGDDILGKTFTESMTKNGVAGHISYGMAKTGTAMAFISPDSERTFATFLGSAVELAPVDLSHAVFKDYDLFHLEGYLVQDHTLIETALDLAQQHGLLVSMDMASYNVVESNRDFLEEVIRSRVDIVFANEEEARALTGRGPEGALEEIAKWCDIAVVKIGKNGSLILSGDTRHHAKALPVQAVDTTGAGDLYASGFLYGLARDLPLVRCADIGSAVAARVIGVVGARLPDSKWAEIRQEINGG